MAAAITACTAPAPRSSSPAVGVKTYDKSGAQTGAYAVTREGVVRMPPGNGWTVTETDGTVRPATAQEAAREEQHLMKLLRGNGSSRGN